MKNGQAVERPVYNMKSELGPEEWERSEKAERKFKKHIEERAMWVKLSPWVSTVYSGCDEDKGLGKGTLQGISRW